MENEQLEYERQLRQYYELAVKLLVQEKQRASKTQNILIEKGLDRETATAIVDSILLKIKEEEKKRSQMDILVGSLFFLGGIVASVAGSGGVFIGAILLGAFRFLRGLGRNY